VQIDEPNIDNASSPDGIPCDREPRLLNESVDQDVKMRIPVLLKFKDRYVLGRNTKLPAPVGPQLVEGVTQVDHAIALNLPRIKG